MSRFKAGDLALVIGGKSMIGECVELIAWINPGDHFGEHWVLDPAEPGGGWHIKGSEECCKDEKNLMPLRGNFIYEEAHDMEKDHA